MFITSDSKPAAEMQKVVRGGILLQQSRKYLIHGARAQPTVWTVNDVLNRSIP